MSAIEIQEALKNMSGEELAQAQNAIVLACDLEPADRSAALGLISRELQIRQGEGLDRKASRFWNRNAQTIAAVAVGALLGDWIGD